MEYCVIKPSCVVRQTATAEYAQSLHGRRAFHFWPCYIISELSSGRWLSCGKQGSLFRCMVHFLSMQAM